MRRRHWVSYTLALALALALVRFSESPVGCAAEATGESLQLEVLQPVYRQSIYATESMPEIVLRVRLSPPLRQQAASIRGRIVDANQREIQRQNMAVAGLDTLRFAAAALAVGQYTVQLQALDADQQVVAQAETAIRKLPPAAGSEVRIDPHRNILVNGKPVVLIGWYGTVPLDDPRPDVVALQNVQTPVVVDYPNKEPLAKAFRERGIYSIVSLEPGRLFYSFQLWRKPGNSVAQEWSQLPAPSDECREYLRQMVELLHDEPGLLGWYLADEPEINNVRADYLENLYRTVRELDPYHPVLITNDTLDGIEKFGYRACDILSPDPYSPKPSYVPGFLQQAARVLQPGQATMLTPWHAAGHTHFTNDFGTDPPYSHRVLRGQYLAGVAFGCRGFTGYASDFFLPEPALRYGLPRVWREVRFLEPAMAVAEVELPPRVEPAEDVVGWISRANGQLYVLLMNFGPSRQFTIRHPRLAGVTSLYEVSSGLQVAVTEGIQTDALAPGDVRLYTNDPAAQQLPTVAAVEAEIAAAARGAVKSGNLLHASRGVRARASEGAFAPWFSQYFYYAINGVTDDIGWYVSHAELPQWLELSLPEEKPVGRVVITTPNLRDYDLILRAADGAAELVEVRGNAATVAEHRFARPIPALKLRIVARAVRDPADPPRAMVREIEAYTEPGAGPLTATRRLESADGGPGTAQDDLAAAAPPDVSPPLWLEDFSRFAYLDRYVTFQEQAWVFNPRDYQFELKQPGIVCTSTADAGYSAMTRIWPYDPQYRYFQIKLAAIEGEGYRFGTVGFGESSGRLQCRGAVQTSKPGIYTVDTHYVHDDFRTGRQKSCFLSLYTNQGIRFTYDWLRLSRLPLDGLSVTLADGSPLPSALKAGDSLLFRVLLDKPATDVVVELYRDSSYAPVRLNGEPYVQLLKTGREKDGRQWSAVLPLAASTEKVKLAGYPLLFRAVITGGVIRETLANVFADIE